MESVTNSFELEPEIAEPVVFERKPVRSRKVKQKRSLKKVFIKFAVVSVLILVSISYATYKVQQFFEAKRIVWQSPIIIRTPVYVEDRVISQKPQIQPIHEAEAAGRIVEVVADQAGDSEPQPKPAARQPSVSELVHAIYRLESSATNSKGCAAKGLFNGYGYIPGTCYKSQAEVKALVTKWVEKRIDTMPLNQMLCTYNLGPSSKHLTECMNQSKEYPYYRDYLSL